MTKYQPYIKIISKKKHCTTDTTAAGGCRNASIHITRLLRYIVDELLCNPQPAFKHHHTTVCTGSCCTSERTPCSPSELLPAALQQLKLTILTPRSEESAVSTWQRPGTPAGLAPDTVLPLSPVLWHCCNPVNPVHCASQKFLALTLTLLASVH